MTLISKAWAEAVQAELRAVVAERLALLRVLNRRIAR